MNIYETLKSGKTPDEVRAIVEKEIKSAQTIIEKEKTEKETEIKETRKTLIDAYDDYYYALTGKWLNIGERESLEQIIKETEKEIVTIQTLLEKPKAAGPKKPNKKPVCTYWKPESVKFTTDDTTIQDFIKTLI